MINVTVRRSPVHGAYISPGFYLHVVPESQSVQLSLGKGKWILASTDDLSKIWSEKSISAMRFSFQTLDSHRAELEKFRLQENASAHRPSDNDRHIFAVPSAKWRNLYRQKNKPQRLGSNEIFTNWELRVDDTRLFPKFYSAVSDVMKVQRTWPWL